MASGASIHVHLRGANNTHPLSWGGGGGDLKIPVRNDHLASHFLEKISIRGSQNQNSFFSNPQKSLHVFLLTFNEEIELDLDQNLYCILSK